MTTPNLGKQNALLTIHGLRLGLSQVDANGNADLLLDGYNVAGIQGLCYQSGNQMAALAGGGQSTASSFIAGAEINVINVVATTSDSVTLPVTAGKIPTGGALALTILNKTSLAAAVFPSSGDAINALGANASLAVASSGVSIFYCVSSGLWLTK